MSEAYSVGKGGKLNLKGEASSSSSKSKHKKHKKRKLEDSAKDLDKEDVLNHAGGWVVDKYEQITGSVFIEFKEQMFLHGLENGVFVCGAPHAPTEQPDVAELLTAVPIDNKYIAFKSTYGKYLSVNSNGLVIGKYFILIIILFIN